MHSLSQAWCPTSPENTPLGTCALLALIPVKSNSLFLSLLPSPFIRKEVHFHLYLKGTVVSAYQRRFPYFVTKLGKSRSKTSGRKRVSGAVI